MVAEPGIAAVDVRQIGAGLGCLVRFRRPHRIGIDLVPSDFRFGVPVRGHAADGKHDVVGRSSIGGKQAYRGDGIADDFSGGGEGEIFRRFGAALFGAGLQNHFQIDRHRVIAAGDHVLLMHVGCGKAVKQRQPAAGAPEKPRETLRIGARRVIDEFGPAVAVLRDRAHGFELDRRLSAVQALDQSVPGGIEPQILRLVDDPRAVLEADDADRAAVIVRIGEIAFESGNAAGVGGMENIAADHRKIGIETQHHFARGLDPLPRDGREQPQQHRLVFEQPPPTAGLHLGDEAIVDAPCRYAAPDPLHRVAANRHCAPWRSARRAPPCRGSRAPEAAPGATTRARLRSSCRRRAHRDPTKAACRPARPVT